MQISNALQYITPEDDLEKDPETSLVARRDLAEY